MEKLDWIAKLQKFGLTVKKLTPWQYRVSCKEASMRVDLYPTNKKFHDIETGERGVYDDEYLFSCASFYRKVKDLNDARVKSNQVERKGGDGVGVSAVDFVIHDEFKMKGGDGMSNLLPNFKENKVVPYFHPASLPEDSADIAAFKFKESKVNVGGLKLKSPTRTHFLKIDKQWLERVRSGEKNCEIRFNDRDFQAGDYIQYIEPKNIGGAVSAKIDHPLIKITHVLHAAQFPEGLKDGYCILSLKFC